MVIAHTVAYLVFRRCHYPPKVPLRVSLSSRRKIRLRHPSRNNPGGRLHAFSKFQQVEVQAGWQARKSGADGTAATTTMMTMMSWCVALTTQRRYCGSDPPLHSSAADAQRMMMMIIMITGLHFPRLSQKMPIRLAGISGSPLRYRPEVNLALACTVSLARLFIRPTKPNCRLILIHPSAQGLSYLQPSHQLLCFFIRPSFPCPVSRPTGSCNPAVRLMIQMFLAIGF